MRSRENEYDLCECGNRKQKVSTQCMECYRLPPSATICECGEPKQSQSKQCLVCYRNGFIRSPTYARERHLRIQYGITIEEFDLLLEAQDWKCAICSTTEPECNLQFQVDHNHDCCPGNKTCGECIRGLLCCRCNQGLGSFHDNVDLLLKAVDYLNSIPLFLLLKRSRDASY